MNDDARDAFAWCLGNAIEAERSGQEECAAGWALIAGRIATRFGTTHLVVPELERLLAKLGRRLQSPAKAGPTRSPPRRWLHVLSISLEIGGHTALATRWIARNPFRHIHDVILTHQFAEDAARRIHEPVERAGGRVVSLAGEKSLMGRAARLRELAATEADVVVLHIHPWDVVAPIAFAAPGGPPVLFLNHYDHGFWTGACCQDLVIDIWESGQHLTRKLRGIDQTVILPVPLLDSGALPHRRERAAAHIADSVWSDAGLVLLTIGQEHKYRPIGGLDFQHAMREIVARIGDCAVIAVGPRGDDPLWQELSRQTGGRVIAVGPDADLAPWHEAADVYLEGFPIGSYTALLEVGLAGRPFVRKPYLMSPSVLPIDRGALAPFDPPPTVDDYIAAAVGLCESADRRVALAQQARTSIRAVHCGEGWTSRLEHLVRAIPPVHQPVSEVPASPLPGELALYWAEINRGKMQRSPMQVARRLAAEAGLSLPAHTARPR